jgi:hypothetical protein
VNIPYDTTLVFANIDGEVVATHIANINTQLVAAGWTSTAVAATQSGTFTGAPANNQTVTIGSTVYTYKTVLTGAAFEIFIGANVTENAANLAAAINAGAGAGSLYGTGTTAHPDVTATSSSGTITITAASSGTAGNAIATTETLNNFTWVAAATAGGGYTLLSAASHPCKYRLLLYVYANASGAPFYRVSAEDTTKNVNFGWLTLATGRTFAIRATSYDCWIIRTDSNSRDFFYCGALWNPAEWGPLTVTTIGAGATTTLTVVGHGFSTADNVTLSGFSGDANWLAQNGKTYACTVTGPNTFTIPLDSSGFATGTPGYAASFRQIGLSLVACGSYLAGTVGGTFRNNLSHRGQNSNNNGYAWTLYNSNVATSNAQNQVAANLQALGIAGSGVATYGVFVGLTGYAMYQPLMLSHGITDHTGNQYYYVGTCWNAVMWNGTAIVNNNLNPIVLDGRNFYNITDKTGMTILWMNGCVFLEIP